jgi:phosphatidylserine synthase
MKHAVAYHSGPSSGSTHVLLVLMALLCGALAGLAAFSMTNKKDVRKAILYGFGVFAAATLFIIQLEDALRLLA